MPKPPRQDHEHKHEHEHEHRHGHEHEHEREREGEGDDPALHARIIARRWIGSAPPTAERWARALQQWSKLPGAVASLPPIPPKKGEKQ